MATYERRSRTAVSRESASTWVVKPCAIMRDSVQPSGLPASTLSARRRWLEAGLGLDVGAGCGFGVLIATCP